MSRIYHVCRHGRWRIQHACKSTNLIPVNMSSSLVCSCKTPDFLAQRDQHSQGSKNSSRHECTLLCLQQASPHTHTHDSLTEKHINRITMARLQSVSSVLKPSQPTSGYSVCVGVCVWDCSCLRKETKEESSPQSWWWALCLWGKLSRLCAPVQ